jgi:hypothetical protein
VIAGPVMRWSDRRRGCGKWIAAAAILAMTGSAYAECAGVGPPLRQSHNPLSGVLSGVGASLSPYSYQALQRQRAERATYDALLAAGAPEPLACAAALNAIAGTYFGRPAR